MTFTEEELKTLTEKFEISEEAIQTLTTLLQEKILEIEAENAAKIEATTAELTAKSEAYAEYVKEEITSKVSEYTDYAMDTFVKENKEKFEKLEMYERMESVFSEVKTVFESNGFKLDENTETNKLKLELDKAKSSFENVFEELQKTKEALVESEMALILEAKTRELTDTQKERIKTLSESVKFNGIEEFQTGLNMLIEQVKRPEKAPVQEVLKEQKTTNPNIEAVLKALSR